MFSGRKLSLSTAKRMVGNLLAYVQMSGFYAWFVSVIFFKEAPYSISPFRPDYRTHRPCAASRSHDSPIRSSTGPLTRSRFRFFHHTASYWYSADKPPVRVLESVFSHIAYSESKT